MSFYQAMQLGAINLKPLIKETEDKKLKQKYITAFVLKNILCLLFFRRRFKWIRIFLLICIKFSVPL